MNRFCYFSARNTLCRFHSVPPLQPAKTVSAEIGARVQKIHSVQFSVHLQGLSLRTITIKSFLYLQDIGSCLIHFPLSGSALSLAYLQIFDFFHRLLLSFHSSNNNFDTSHRSMFEGKGVYGFLTVCKGQGKFC
jgi:hypothetical protein